MANPAFGGSKGAEVTVVVSLRAENVPQTPIASQSLDAPVPAGSLPLPKVSNDYDTDHGIEEIDRVTSEPTTTDTHLKVEPIPHHFR